MNTILVLVDSLNRHSLAAYGPTRVATPNLDRFARRAQRFDNHFVGSLPCMPARREIYSGRKEMMWRPWGPLEPFDERLPRLLERAGYSTAIVTDHYHYWAEAGNGYLQSFGSRKHVRGHETDAWRPAVAKSEPVPGWVERIEEFRPAQARRYYANVREFRGEEEYFAAKVFGGACRWLERHAAEGSFFLQVETFDVHEPFDVPEPYRSIYADGSRRDLFNVWPPYQDPAALARFMAGTSEEELEFIRAQYDGKLTMVDRWFGELLDTLDRLALWDETMVVVTTDHGHDLGQRGAFGKQWPHFDTHANIPLFVWHPRYPTTGVQHAALTSTVDLFATVLDAMGVPIPTVPHSRSLLPLVAGETAGHRQALLYGTFGQGLACTDGEWTLLRSPVGDETVFAYTCSIFPSQVALSAVRPVDHGFFIPGVELPQWKIPIDSAQAPLGNSHHLFHRTGDPGQERDLWQSESATRGRLLGLMAELLHDEGAPPEQFGRLGLGSP
jgi:arylsulfatase A-like enzyme